MSKYSEYKVILVGLGPHAKRIYINLFKKYKINLELLVDLKSQKEKIKEFLNKNNFTKTELFLIDDSYKDLTSLPDSVSTNLKKAIKSKNIKYAIISTEPKAHFMYAKFFYKIM